MKMFNINHINHIQFIKDIRRDYGQQILEQLLEKISFTSILENEFLYKIGEHNSKFFILLSGKLQVYMQFESEQLKKVTEIFPIQSFGEESLFNEKCKMNQTIQAIQPSYLAILNRRDYQTIIGKYQQNNLENKIKLLLKLECFNFWTISQFKNLAYTLYQQKFCLNEIVYKENEQSLFLYIVAEGEFEMSKYSIHNKYGTKIRYQTICLLNEGQIFGEECLLTKLDDDPKIVKPYETFLPIIRYSTIKCISITGSLYRLSSKTIIDECWDSVSKSQFLQLISNLKNFRLQRIYYLDNSRLRTEPDQQFEKCINKCQRKCNRSPKLLQPMFTNTFFKKYFLDQKKEKPLRKQYKLSSIETPKKIKLSYCESPQQQANQKQQQFHKLLSQRYQRSTTKQEVKQQQSFEIPSTPRMYYKQFLASSRLKSIQ